MSRNDEKRVGERERAGSSTALASTSTIQQQVLTPTRSSSLDLKKRENRTDLELKQQAGTENVLERWE